MKRRGCEVITTPSNLNIEVYCHPVLGADASVIVVKDNKPRRERRDKNTSDMKTVTHSYANEDKIYNTYLSVLAVSVKVNQVQC
nr:unnamed protein product [Callosobruchus analis]